jgi:hypothetical protein
MDNFLRRKESSQHLLLKLIRAKAGAVMQRCLTPVDLACVTFVRVKRERAWLSGV